ncbi:MAG TPA: flagellar basal body P-ring formation chaperone FlgA [Steroidobacteraceae bacterium]
MARDLQSALKMERPPKYRQWLQSRLAGCVLTVAAWPGGGWAADLQDVAQLEALARAAAIGQLPPVTERQRLLVGPILPNIRLERCDKPVAPIVGPAQHMKDRLLVELRCQGSIAWHLYVPVRIIGTSSVAIAAHAIVAGSVLTAGDLKVEQRDVTALPPGYLDDPAVALGLTVARPISSGAILTNQQLVASKAVQRGQAVTLIANAGGMSVRMAGRALTDGFVNQRVRVQNLSSGKVVEGLARSEQVVEIIFQ